MIAIDHSQEHAVSVRGLEGHFANHHHVAHPDAAALYNVRLALDLQVDAMLLTLAASARHLDVDVPWQRWLVEDLELARVLTGALVDSGVEPSPSLGTTTSGLSTHPLDNLVARYQSMAEALGQALARPSTGQDWRAAATHALHRCRTRIDELHANRSALMERRAAERLAASGAVDRHRRDAYLPGELLG